MLFPSKNFESNMQTTLNKTCLSTQKKRRKRKKKKTTNTWKNKNTPYDLHYNLYLIEDIQILMGIDLDILEI